jgi:hypothetical protein
VRISRNFLALSAVLTLGACALPDMDSFRAPTADVLFRRTSVTNYKDKVLPPVAPEDLVDAGGRCAGAYVPPAAPAEGEQPAPQGNVSLQEAGVPMIPAAVALDMSECDVVKRAGFAERVEIGANERNERTATLTYLVGPRPGIYHFTAGRLKSMERAPEPPPPVKPVKPAKKKPPKSRQTAAVHVQ